MNVKRSVASFMSRQRIGRFLLTIQKVNELGMKSEDKYYLVLADANEIDSSK